VFGPYKVKTSRKRDVLRMGMSFDSTSETLQLGLR
jgi:hypothetical protein